MMIIIIIEKVLEELEIRVQIEIIQTVDINRNTEKSLGDLKWLAAIQTPVKEPQFPRL